MGLLIFYTDAAQPEDKGLPRVRGLQDATSPEVPQGHRVSRKLNWGKCRQKLLEANTENQDTFCVTTSHCVPQMQKSQEPRAGPAEWPG